jgi:hypothetical protein
MPEQEQGRMRGFQLWLNLPARDKMCAPRYQEFGPSQIPAAEPAPGVTIRVIAGRVGTIVGPIVQPATDPVYLDVSLAAAAAFDAALPPGHAAFLYVYEGAIRVGGAGGTAGASISASTLGVLGPGASVLLTGQATENRAILVAGRPLREPVARRGPFVMNTREELAQAFADLQGGRF